MSMGENRQAWIICMNKGRNLWGDCGKDLYLSCGYLLLFYSNKRFNWAQGSSEKKTHSPAFSEDQCGHIVYLSQKDLRNTYKISKS